MSGRAAAEPPYFSRAKPARNLRAAKPQVNGFATKTKALAHEIPPATQARELTLKCKLKCYICVPSATRHNIHLYPYFLFAAIHHLKSAPTFSVRPCSSVGRVTVDLIRRSWVRFPPRSKDFFFASCGSLFPFTRANAPFAG